MEVLLSQFEDDTTLCLDSSEESFNKSIQTNKKFAFISRLKMNNEKTQVGRTLRCNFQRIRISLGTPVLLKSLVSNFQPTSDKTPRSTMKEN